MNDLAFKAVFCYGSFNMSEINEDNTTILELAEILADKNSDLREVSELLEAEQGANVDLELKIEDLEKARAALYSDLISFWNKHFIVGMGADFEELCLKHFADLA